MRRSLVAVLGIVVLFGLAAAGLEAHPSTRRGSTSTCTAAQKAARQKALAAYQKRMLRERKAYLKTHKSKKRRAAFVKRQRAMLKALRAAARSTVAPAITPPSSGPACAPSLSTS